VKKAADTRNEDFVSELITRVSESRKYRHLGIPPATLRDLADRALSTHTDPRQVEKIVRYRLHNLVAPYLGDPDYGAMSRALAGLPSDPASPEVKHWCEQLLNTHASTRERIPLHETFYGEIFSLTGTPRVLLDVACGLNPFALPWMGLPLDTQYLAYDLHQPRVELINAFLTHVHQEGSARHQDILVDPPQVKADVIFFFKEAHRFDQRERGANREFFRKLRTRWLLVSLPTVSLSGHRSMIEGNRRLVAESCAGEDWQMSELVFDSEMVFCIRKQP
jgi:16S rRNA (guanine(1405)-N(7))-methyltransferase